MSTQVQFRRGTAAENNAFTGAIAEITVDTTNYTLRVHDGSTAGGFATISASSTETLTNKTLSAPTITGNITGNLVPAANATYDLGASDALWGSLYLAGNTIFLGNLTLSAGADDTLSILGPGNVEASISIDSFSQGNSVIGIAGLDGNAFISVNDTTNVVVVTNTEMTVTGVLSATGNIHSASNVIASDYVFAVGNVIGGNVTTAGLVFATGNVTGGNVTTDGTVVAAGDVTGGNLTTDGTISAVGNVTAGNISTVGLLSTGDLSVTANAVIGGDLTVNGNLAYVNVETMAVEDPIIGVGRGPNNDPLSSSDGKDRGMQLWYYDTAESTAFFGLNTTTGNLFAASNVSITNDLVTVNGWGNFQVGSLTTVTDINTQDINATGNLSVSDIDSSANVIAQNITANFTVTANNISSTNSVDAAVAGITGNLTAGNIISNGSVSAAGNVDAGNAVITGDVNSDTVTVGSTVSAVGNIVGGNLVTAGDVTTATVNATGNITGANVLTAGVVSASGNVTGGNIVTAGDVTTATVNATGNVTGANIVTAGAADVGSLSASATISASGNVTGANIVTAGAADVGSLSASATISASGNVTGANIVTAGAADVGSLSASATISASGNVTGANIVTAGDVTTATVNATGNVTGGNVVTGGIVLATGNVTGGNIVTAGDVTTATVTASSIVSAIGNVTGGNITTAGDVTTATLTASNIVSATGNITGGNITTAGDVTTATVTASSTVSAVGNVTGGNIVTAGDVTTASVTASSTVSAVGNVTGGNITTAGLITATGNITGGNIVTAGGVDTGTVTASSTISAAGNVTGGNIVTAGVLSVSGTGVSSFAGNVDMNSKHVLNLAEPVNATDAATKQYVDTLVSSGIHFHTAVRVESPIALNATYNNGTDGVGATLTNAGANAALVIDGISVNTSDRVLVYQQADAIQNGVYVVTTVGDGSTAWVLTRATDADSYAPSTDDGLDEGSYFFVQEGDTGAGESYVVSTVGEIVFGTTAINFVQFSSAQVYQAGTGLTLTGTEFSVDASQTQITAVGTLGSLSVTGNIDGGNVSGTRGAFTNVAGTLETAAQTNITSVGTLVSLDVTGNVTAGNLSGTSIVGTLTTAAQTNITSVGTLGSLTVTGNVTGGNLITAGLVSLSSITKTGSNGVGNIGASTSTFDTVFAKATSAQYADVAEYYIADRQYPVGTVLVFGGDQEVTESSASHASAIAGVVSSNPAVVMNSGLDHDNRVLVALLGRVPCRVKGPVRKGDCLAAGSAPGVAVELDAAHYRPGCIIGKALEDVAGEQETVIEVVVGRL